MPTISIYLFYPLAADRKVGSNGIMLGVFYGAKADLQTHDSVHIAAAACSEPCAHNQHKIVALCAGSVAAMSHGVHCFCGDHWAGRGS